MVLTSRIVVFTVCIALGQTLLVFLLVMAVACGHIGVESLTTDDSNSEMHTDNDSDADSDTETATDFNTDSTDTGDGLPTCSDGIKNKDELRVDCGGSICSACPACTAVFGTPEELTIPDSPVHLFGPSLSVDDVTLYFSAGDIDPGNIFTATRPDRGTVFSNTSLLSEVNTPDNEGTPFITVDRLSLYFYSTRPSDEGARDIWTATRSDPDDAFGTSVLLPVVNSHNSEQLPSLTADELLIVFSSNRNGSGSMDLWFAERSDRSENFSAPTSATSLNTADAENAPSLSPDGLTIYFVSDRPGGLGDFDIWTASRSDRTLDFSDWAPVAEVNSPGAEYDSAISPDEQELFFSSNRSGDFHLFRAWRDCPAANTGR